MKGGRELDPSPGAVWPPATDYSEAGRQMSKLSDKKLCADSECSREIQGSYYGDQEARLGYLPSSVVEETHALMPAEVEPAEVFE
ncbi:melanoma-derived growth regulatory protein-like [Sinocyclocheilus anshuiensis]|uniref:melanoma-derived growth regulatory protein-like n=1 Tax=Sinocyclocheilus anshuiensis TaxID=1608454 RepID=UPI0007BAC28D|nr:PREDICTED: melanoma-derived growth regulatory protein-like [Sinocyclocheilus anshuiensis]